jgi:UDP-N-acetylglucosamine acyltransferase
VISDLAMIHPSARLAEGVTVGPGTVIGADVEIGAHTWIGPHVVIEGPTRIGKHNKIFQFSSIGDAPQDVTYQGEPTRLEIGDHNVIREYCMVSRGTVKGGGLTRIGEHNYLMAHVHIGHDCVLGNHIIMVNYAALSGHVIVQDYVYISGYAAVHQFCQLGESAFISRATYISKDVLPYVTIAGYESESCGINTVGLRRRGMSSAVIDTLRRAYKIIYRKGHTVQEALTELELIQNECPEVIPMIEALNQSTRGIVR